MYSLIRPLFFKLEEEQAHQYALKVLHWLPQFCFQPPKQGEITAMGLTFPHPVGLAAGLDKNGEHLDALAKIGFSFIEAGTVTPRPQYGNPKPRLFRLPSAYAIINRMGFNNCGVDTFVKNVSRAKYKGVLGINIGKNKDTPLTRAADDYLECLRKVYRLASYITINISSPNTPDLRLLQQNKFFRDLLSKLVEEQTRLADQEQRFVPLVIKLSPDESEETLKELAHACVDMKISGIIATNTTCARDGVANLPHSFEQGGLSGAPLFKRSTECLAIIKKVVGNELTLIGVGGIDSPEVAQEKLNAGANLLQVYTGLIYKGPGLVSQLANAL